MILYHSQYTWIDCFSLLSYLPKGSEALLIFYNFVYFGYRKSVFCCALYKTLCFA